MIFIIFTVVVTLTLAVLFKPRSGYRKLLIESKNDFKSSFPAIASNLEDFVFQSYDKVCK